MKKIMNLKNIKKNDNFLILFIIYILHLVLIISEHSELAVNSKIFRYIYIFRIHRWILSFPIIYYFTKTYKEYEYFKTNEKLDVQNFNMYFALAFWIGNISSFLTQIIFKFKEQSLFIKEPLYISIIMTVCVAPILEEIVFRGVIMNNLKKYGVKTAIIVNSVLFGLAHYNIDMIIPAFFTGIIFSYVACKYSIKYSIFMHFLLNAITKISQIMIIFRIKILVMLFGLVSFFLILFLLIFFIIGLLEGKYKEIFSIFKLSSEDKRNMTMFLKNNLLYLMVIFEIVICNWLFNYRIF